MAASATLNNAATNELTDDGDPGLPGQPRPARPHAHAAGVHAGVAVVGREEAQRPVPQVVVAEGDGGALDRRPVLRDSDDEKCGTLIDSAVLSAPLCALSYMDGRVNVSSNPKDYY